MTEPIIPDFETLKQVLLAKGFALAAEPSRPYLIVLFLERPGKVPIVASSLPTMDKRLLSSS